MNTSKKILVSLVLVLGYSIIAMLLFRLVLIPKFTATKYGEIPGDSLIYAELALKNAANISTYGIGAFELKPEGQGPAGVATLVYLMTGQIGFIVIINALLHMLASWALFGILRIWFGVRESFIGVLPFVLSVCMMFWFSQTNKESFCIAGIFIFMWGYLIEFTNLCHKKHKFFWKDSLLRYLGLVIGVLLIYLVRPYVAKILLISVLPVYLISVIISHNLRLNMRFHFFTGFVVFILMFSSSDKGSGRTLALLDDIDANCAVIGCDGSRSTSVMNRCFAQLKSGVWNSDGVPEFINKKIIMLLGQRCLNLSVLDNNPNKTVIFSTVDPDIVFNGPKDAALYLFRAAQIGIFAPWPSHWPSMALERLSVPYRITAIEAFFVYACYLFLVFGLFFAQLRFDILLPIFFALNSMLITGFSCPFLVVTYRYRYAWWMLLACLGFAFLTQYLLGNGAKEKRMDSGK